MCKLSRGERFQDARQVHNKNGRQTMDEVASAIKIKKSMLSDLENDDIQRDVKCSYIALLSKYYGVSSDFLLGLTDDPSVHYTAVDELGLKVENIEWLKYLGKTIERDYDIPDILNHIFEDHDYRMMVSNLINYICALEFEMKSYCLLHTHEEQDGPGENWKAYKNNIAELAQNEKFSTRERIFLNAEYERLNLSKDGLWQVLTDNTTGFTLSSMFEYRASKYLSAFMQARKEISVEVRENYVSELKKGT